MGRKKKVVEAEEVKTAPTKVVKKQEPKKSWFEAMQEKIDNKK